MTGYKILPLEGGDIADINRIKPEGWSDLQGIHRYYLANRFCYPRKIVYGGELAGIGTAITHGETGWLAHVIVSEGHRNRGLGKFLVTSLLDLLTRDLGCRAVSLIATDLGYPVYSRCGFQVQTEYLGFRNESPSEEITDPALFPLAESTLSRICELDRRISGEERSHILAPHGEKGWGYGSRENPEGFYLPGLGEGLIMADSEEGGKALLRVCLSEKARITLPRENEGGRDFLAGLGLAEAIRMRRMVRGEPFPWRPRSLYNRIGGYLG